MRRRTRAFVDADGEPLQAERLIDLPVRTLRRVDINAEFNSAFAAACLHARFDTRDAARPTKDDGDVVEHVTGAVMRVRQQR